MQFSLTVPLFDHDSRLLATASTESDKSRWVNDESPSDASRISSAIRPTPPTGWWSVTHGLIVLNVVVFVLVAIVYRFWPNLDLLEKGSNLAPLVVDGEWWRLFTSGFLHVSVAHLLGNIFALRMLGRESERLLGRQSFLLLYLSCGAVGSLAGLIYDPEHGMIGASPAIFGLAGALIVIWIWHGLTLSKKTWGQLLLLVLWTGYSIYPDSATATLSVVGHIAGLITGALLGSLMWSDFAKTPQRQLWLFSAVAILLGLGTMCVRHFNGYLVPLGDGMHAFANGRREEAVREFRTALQNNPHSLLANTFIAEAYITNEDYAEAEPAVQHALAADQSDEHAKYLLGIVRLHTGYCNEAHNIGDELYLHTHDEEYKRKAEALSIAKCDINGFGDRFVSEGRAETAVGLYLRALSENAHDYRAERGLANAYRALGREQDAKAADARADAIKRQHL
jgi:rhomboid protease GluP